MSVYMTEEEQLQAIKKWWRQYNTPILILLSVVMLSVSGYRYWNWHHDKVLTQASIVYERLMVSFSEHKNREISSYANQLMKDYDQTVYADAARMTLAEVYVAKNQMNKAQQLLEDVVIRSKVPVFKQISKIRIARLLLAQKNFDQALNQLAVVDDNAYMTIVNELKGDISVEQGEYQEAIKSYQKAISEAKQHGIGNLFLEMKTNEITALAQSNHVSKETIGSA